MAFHHDRARLQVLGRPSSRGQMWIEQGASGGCMVYVAGKPGVMTSRLQDSQTNKSTPFAEMKAGWPS